MRRARRKAASKVLATTFLTLSAIANHALALWPWQDWDDTFTEKEKAYLEATRLQVHEAGERCRKLSHKLSR